MIKVAAAVIKYEDKVLLMRRAPGQKHAGFWEFPSGKVENGERLKSALKRELDEELYIKAHIGNMITSASDGEYEVFAYNVVFYDGLITLHVHDTMEWVPLKESLKYKLLPADRKIIMHMTKTKEEKQEPVSLESVLCKLIEKPRLDENTKQYVVQIKNPVIGESSSFKTYEKAMQFYIETVRNIIHQCALDARIR